MEVDGVHGSASQGLEGRVHPGRDGRDPAAAGRQQHQRGHHRQLPPRRPHQAARRRVGQAARPLRQDARESLVNSVVSSLVVAGQFCSQQFGSLLIGYSLIYVCISQCIYIFLYITG